MATDYDLLGSKEVLNELQNGRTRELLLLLQDRPIPEVVDPMNVQTGLSNNYIEFNSDYQLKNEIYIANFEDGTVSFNDENSNWEANYSSRWTLNSNSEIDGIYSAEISADGTRTVAGEITRNSPINTDSLSFKLKFSHNINSNDSTEIQIGSSSAPDLDRITFYNGGEVQLDDNTTVLQSWEANKVYHIECKNIGGGTYDMYINGNMEVSNASYGSWNGFGYMKFLIDNQYSGTEQVIYTDEYIEKSARIDGYVTDQFSAPTTAPTDFKQWHAIRAEDVTTGGSTSANAVEFEILDSTDTVLTTSNIPKSEFADEKFQLRDRQYSEDATSNGQSNYTIPETGDGGHFGLPIWTVVTVKKNGSVLATENWEYDDVDTVSIDTSAVTISSGDTITITYDFDVFDSTLKTRAYLNRESGSETSPSISHFRYEYEV